MEKSCELLSQTPGERQAGLVGFFALWRGSLRQRGPKSEPYDPSRQQQHELVLNRPKPTSLQRQTLFKHHLVLAAICA